MIAKTLVLVCAAFGLVAGSCFEIRAPQQCSSQIFSIPSTTNVDSGCGVQSAPVFSDNIFSNGASDSTQVLSIPVSSSSDNIFSSGISSFATPVATTDSTSFSDAFSGSFGSSFSSSGVQASNGPETAALQVLQAPAVTLPAVEGPIVTLSSQPIPAPRILSQRCICTKTIVRPQVYQRQVTVPKIQRYLKRTVTPVVENVAYKSTPIAQETSSAGSVCGYSGAQSNFASAPVIVSSGSFGSQSSYASAPTSFVASSGSGSGFSGCGSQTSYISAPIVSSGSCAKVC